MECLQVGPTECRLDGPTAFPVGPTGFRGLRIPCREASLPDRLQTVSTREIGVTSKVEFLVLPRSPLNRFNRFSR